MRSRLALISASSRLLAGFRSFKSQAAAGAHSSKAAAMDYDTTVTPGQLGVVTLQRDKTLNAISLEMSLGIDKALRSWRSGEEKCSAMILHSESERAICAGGDIKAIRQFVIDKPFDNEMTPPVAHNVVKLFQAEYSLTVDLATLPFPSVAICHGVWMGFGVGLAGFLDSRVVTEKTTFAMPECSIGLFPDVAFAFLSAKVGMSLPVVLYLGLTGARMSDPADLISSGLATHYVHSANLPDLRKELLEASYIADAKSTMEGILVKHSSEVSSHSGKVMAQTGAINAVMEPSIQCLEQGGTAVAAVQLLFQQLEQQVSSKDVAEAHKQWCRDSLAGLKRGSPRSLAVAANHIFTVHKDTHSNGPLGTIQACISREFDMITKMSAQHDFREGVRAAVVDKDKNPSWIPSRWDDVDQQQIEALLAPAPEVSLAL